MSSRKTPFEPGYIYHVFTRGVEQRSLFMDDRDRRRLVLLLAHCIPARQQPSFSIAQRLRKEVRLAVQRAAAESPLAYLLCYCLMPNHLHFLLQEHRPGGISAYLQRLLNSYARYFNSRHQRTGPLFAGPFRSVHVSTTELFLHVSRYIHLNPYAAGLTRDPLYYRWSSLDEYLDGPGRGICRTEFLLNVMNRKEYSDFVAEHAAYARSLEAIKATLKVPA